MKKNKIKLTNFGKLFFLVIAVIIALIIFSITGNVNDKYNIKNKYSELNSEESTNNSSNTNNNLKDKNYFDYSEYITDTEESDNDVINTTFASGLPLDTYKSLITKKLNYVKSNGKYEKFTYDFENKLHYTEIEKMLLNLNNSDIVDLEVIGKTVDERNMYGVEIGKGTDVIFIDANIHAAEIASTVMLMRFMGEIVNDYENNNSEIVKALNNVKLAIIPSINPDGYEIYNFGLDALNNKNLWWYQVKDTYNFKDMKSNANGIDINRNFPTQNAGLYFKGKSLLKNVAMNKTTKNGVFFGGKNLGSEPETQATMYFMLKHYQNTIYYLNMHSQGRVIYAGKPNLANEFNNITQNYAKRVAKINGYRVHGLSSEEVGEGNDGTATDFMAELANGFEFSTKTLKLSTDKHINNSCTLKYSFPVVTIETLNKYTDDVSVFKNEYYNYGIRKVFYDVLKNK